MDLVSLNVRQRSLLENQNSVKGKQFMNAVDEIKLQARKWCCVIRHRRIQSRMDNAEEAEKPCLNH